jgi:hypothetical protein
VILGLACASAAARAGDVFELKKVRAEPQTPVRVAKTADGGVFVNFGRDAFGWLELEIDSPDERKIDVRLGEKLSGAEAIDPKPGGTIRSVATTLPVTPGKRWYRVETPADKRNTSGDAIRVPAEFGVVLPFRYAELRNAPGEINTGNVRRQMMSYPFDDDASSFVSSDEHLNAVYDLCKYSIKATTAFGVYVDGDRERIPYEADAYINQLAHYGVDAEYALARHTHEYLLAHPTWPTEWKQHSVLMAHADWMHTGDTQSIRRNWRVLKGEKTLTKFARPADGLLDTHELRDVVDWPAGERDGFVMSPVNTVVNAFHYRTLVLMSEMAAAINEAADAKPFGEQAARVREAFNAKLFDDKRGVYVDGEGVEHASLHANLFALAFGLVPDERKPRVIEFIESRGMACSVYPAQFLLEALFENGRADAAMGLMTSDSDRSWRNMLKVGSTITLEAWDAKYKPNLDWNHAWGAAPANIIPRYVLGVRPTSPGFAKMTVQPQVGPLKRVEGTVPTIRGPVIVKVDAEKRRMEVEIPPGATASVVVPWSDGPPREVDAGRHVFE